MSSTQYPPHTDLLFIHCNANSFLPTDRHSGFLINTRTHAVTHSGELHLNMPASKTSLHLSLSVSDTQRLHLYLYKHIHSILHVWHWHTLWKWTLTVCRSFRFHNSNSSSLSMPGSRPVGITHTHRWGGVSLWPLTSIKLSRNHTYWPFLVVVLSIRATWWLLWSKSRTNFQDFILEKKL